MSDKWYDNDWLTIIWCCIGIICMLIGNYYYNGGHLVW